MSWQEDFENMTPEQKKLLFRGKGNEWWEDKTPEERQEISDKRVKTFKETMSSKTFEETEAIKAKISDSWKTRRPLSDASREKMSKSQYLRWERASVGEIEAFGKACSEASKGRVFTKEHCENLSKANSGRKHSEETRLQMSKSHMRVPRSEETKRKISETKKGVPMSLETRIKLSIINSGKTLSEETKAKIGKASSRVWANYSESDLEWIGRRNSEGQARYWRDLPIGERQRRAPTPNSVEIDIGELLESNFPGDWKYTGDKTFWIGTKNPDFTNINGKKAVIEHFGQYYHSPWYFPGRLSEEELIAYYKEWGFDCIVLHEEYLCSDYVVREVSKLYK